MHHLKALLLIPAAFVGTFTALLFNVEPASFADAVLSIGIAVVMNLVLLGALAWAWTKRGRVLGHSFATWVTMLVIAYGLGFGLMFVSQD